MLVRVCLLFFITQKTAYEMRISDWSSDVCSSDLHPPHWRVPLAQGRLRLGCHSALSRNRPQLVDRNVRELPKGDRHPVKVLVALDEFASLGRSEERRVGKGCVST